MTPSTFTLRILEHVHGHAGWLAVAALIHPAIVLRDPRRRARLSVALSVGFVTFVGGLGGYLYYFYSHLLRRSIYLANVRWGMLFERKEHLAFGAIMLAWAGALLHLFAHHRVQSEGQSEGEDVLAIDASMRARAAHVCFVGAAALALIVAVFGTAIAGFRTF
jgi:hypothetical protein